MDIVIKTRRGMERIAASYIEEIVGEIAKVTPSPSGYLGVIFVSGIGDVKYKVAEEIASKIPEVDRVLVVEKIVESKLDEIVEGVVEVAKKYVSAEDTFAIRTTRRGSHDFTSIDVNVKAGAAVKSSIGAEVDLEEPSKPIYVEIFGEFAAIAVPVTEEFKKMRKGKPLPSYVLRKISIGQLIYEGPRDAVYNMGVRIGRAAQTFEIGELNVLLHKSVEADVVSSFLSAIAEGIESRYKVQLGSYGRPVHKVPVYLYELYQFVRDRREEPIVVTDPKGAYITHVKEQIAGLFKARRVNFLIGAREGIPTGVFRFADLIVDLIPQVTISTDFVIPSTIIAVLSALEETGAIPKYEKKLKRGN